MKHMENLTNKTVEELQALSIELLREHPEGYVTSEIEDGIYSPWKVAIRANDEEGLDTPLVVFSADSYMQLRRLQIAFERVKENLEDQPEEGCQYPVLPSLALKAMVVV